MKALEALAAAIGGAVALSLSTKFLPQTPTATTTPPSGANPSAPMWPKCIELCSETVSSLPKPVGDGVLDGLMRSNLLPAVVGIGTALIAINVSQLETKDEISKLNQSLQQRLTVPIGPNGGKNFGVNLSDILGISDNGISIADSIKTDWANAAAVSAWVSIAASLAAQNFDKAASAIAGAAGKLEGLAASILNQYAWGFGYFGTGGGVSPVVSTRARTTMASIADTVNI